MVSLAKKPHLHVLENLPLSVVDYEGAIALDERQLEDHGLPRHPQVTCNNLILTAALGAVSSKVCLVLWYGINTGICDPYIPHDLPSSTHVVGHNRSS